MITRFITACPCGYDCNVKPIITIGKMDVHDAIDGVQDLAVHGFCLAVYSLLAPTIRPLQPFSQPR